MKRQQHITNLNRTIKAGEELMQVSKQNFKAAARIVSEAKSALRELGASPGRARKGKTELPEDIKISLRAGMIKK